MSMISRADLDKVRDSLSTARKTRVDGIVISVYDVDQLRELASILEQSGCTYSVLDAPADLEALYEGFGQRPADDDDLPQYMITIAGSLDELRAATRLMEAAVNK